VHDAEELVTNQRDGVIDLYGKVPLETWVRLRSEVKKVDPEHYRTFREDYEFYGVQDGEVIAQYGGQCSVCGLSCEINTSKVFWPPKGRDDS
jgi:hypothetical protein